MLTLKLNCDGCHNGPLTAVINEINNKPYLWCWECDTLWKTESDYYEKKYCNNSENFKFKRYATREDLQQYGWGHLIEEIKYTEDQLMKIISQVCSDYSNILSQKNRKIELIVSAHCSFDTFSLFTKENFAPLVIGNRIKEEAVDKLILMASMCTSLYEETRLWTTLQIKTDSRWKKVFELAAEINMELPKPNHLLPV